MNRKRGFRARMDQSFQKAPKLERGQGIKFSFPETSPKPRTGEIVLRCRQDALERNFRDMLRFSVPRGPAWSGGTALMAVRSRHGTGVLVDEDLFFPHTQKGADLLFKLKRNLKSVNMNSFFYFFKIS